ncbi:Putative amidase domain-containing protein [Bacillus sp. 491mf]|uniref:amidase domain-containing protein n=1 Tax=Bacillus sp. 491mf TaxID=1761755 RepID=UPI0008E9CB45|nr:amidase domain-containing protein [Bacillus sp. 491mf]SFD70290.1 Putative amidase domain-containing protein [Bacillus sp. 491mf]
MKFSKVFFSFALVFVFLFIQIYPSHAEEKRVDDYTFGEIESMLFNYFKENNLSYKMGSEELDSYLFNQLMHHKDKNLEKHPKYDLILAYAAEYLHEKSLYTVESASTNKKSFATIKNENPKFNMNNVSTKTIGNIKETVENEDAQAKVNQMKRAPKMAALGSGGYNASQAASYAVKWATGRNPSYEDYSGSPIPGLGGGGDCTNFVSQAVLAGGKWMNKPDGINNSTPTILDGNTYWYCVGIPNGNGNRMNFKATQSWTVVEGFYTYWTSRGVSSYETYSPKALEGVANVGDVIQYKNDTTGRKWHSLMVTNKSPGSFQISQHSKDRKNAEIGYILSNDEDVRNSKLIILQFTRS